MASKAREGCQPVRQTSSLPGPPTDGSVGYVVSRCEQKAQTASQQSPGTASACDDLIALGSCDRVPRNNGCCCCFLFLTFSALVANPKKLLYTVAIHARGLLNREKKKKKKSGSAPPPPPPRARCSFGEKNNKKIKKSRDASTCLRATQVDVTQVVSVRLASVQGFLRLVS